MHSITVVILACAIGALLLAWEWRRLPPDQAAYRGAYLKASVASSLGIRRTKYTGLGVNKQETAYWNNADVLTMLGPIFDGWLPSLLLLPATGFALTLGVGLWFSVPRDRRQARQRRNGRVVTGPRLVSTAAEFNRIVQGDGLALPQVIPRLFGGDAPSQAIRLPRSIEEGHVLIEGTTGQGKTILIEEFLDYAAHRGDSVVCYDPGGVLCQHHFVRERGDQHLDVGHRFMPLWNIGHEIVHQHTDAAAIAEALFHLSPNETNRFFVDAARAIFARLLEYRPSVHDLVAWMCDRDAILRLVTPQDVALTPRQFDAALDAHPLDPTSLADIVSDDAPAQRSGVMAQFQIAAQTLLLCPDHDTYGRWSATQWAESRRGWLWLTNTPASRARTVPLTTLWMDLAILRAMEYLDHPRHLWVIGDEWPTLKRVPMAPVLAAEGRRRHITWVAGMQDKGQLYPLYGQDAARSMTGNARTKFYLAMTDAKAAKEASDTIGHVEMESVKQTRTRGGFGKAGSRSETLEIQTRPLVMPSVIQTLPPRRGYLQYGEVVAELNFTWKDRPKIYEGIVEREPAPARERPTPPATTPLTKEDAVAFLKAFKAALPQTPRPAGDAHTTRRAPPARAERAFDPLHDD